MPPTIAAGNRVNAAEGDSPKVPLIPFTRAARELTETGMDESKTIGASAVSVAAQDIPSVGWLRYLILDALQSGGAAGGTNAVAEADAPWSALDEVAVHDVNGQPLFGPMTGYDAYLVNKYGGYVFDPEPANDPAYATVDTDGDFRMQLRVPLEIIAREALGALPNQNSSAAYKLKLTVGDETKVYSTSPGTIGSLRLRSYVEAWSQPNPTAPNGAPQATTPKYAGTLQFWSKQVYNVSSGQQTIRLNRVGNLIRNLILVWRDSSGVRQAGTLPDPISLYFDGQPIHSSDPKLLRDKYVRERYGFDPDTGVVVYDFTHDFDGHPGGETKDLWMPTVQSSRLEVRGSFGEAGTLTVLTNDVRPNVGGVA